MSKKKTMNVNLLVNTVAWFGKYSGYECLVNYFNNKLSYFLYNSDKFIFNRIIGKIYQIKYNWKTVSPTEIHSGVKFLKNINRSDISHILYLEQHIHLLEYCNDNNKLIGTIHLPISQWKEKNLNLLPKLNNVIILYEKEIDIFSKYIPRKNIHLIKHGVATNFFKPNYLLDIKRNKVLFVGHYLRNFEMLYEVYDLVKQNILDTIEFHFIIPNAFRNQITVIGALSDNSNVFFHEKLSDEELLEHYQNSYVLLMPMQDSGANTAIVQAISVGLPIITTDVGGIRSYGGGDIFPIVPNNDSIKMFNLFEKYYYDQDYRDTMSRNLREYAIKNLEWNLIAEQHKEVYNQINIDNN